MNGANVTCRTAGRRAGFTMIELMIALVLALIVVLAMARIILANQRAWEWGRDKVVLQQNVTEALEQMERSVRAANRLSVVGSTEFRTYDRHAVLLHTYRLVQVGADWRLREDGRDLVDRSCSRFNVLPGSDTTNVTIDVEFIDNSGDRVAATTRAAVRNRTFVF